MNPTRRAGWSEARGLVLVCLVGLLLGAPAIASTLFEGKGWVYSVDQGKQSVIINGDSYGFDLDTRFLDGDGRRTTSSVLQNPKHWNGLPGAMISPMAIKFEARETASVPVLTVVQVLPGGLD